MNYQSSIYLEFEEPSHIFESQELFQKIKHLTKDPYGVDIIDRWKQFCTDKIL